MRLNLFSPVGFHPENAKGSRYRLETNEVLTKVELDEEISTYS